MKEVEKSKINSKEVLFSLFAIFVLIIMVAFVSYAAFSYSGFGQKTNTITTGTIKMEYSEPENGIKLTDALPMSDENGKKLIGTNNVFDFSVKATINGSGETNISYDVTAVKDSSSSVPDSAIKVYLTSMDSNADTQVLAPTKVSSLKKTTGNEVSNAPSGEYKLTNGNFTASGTHKYRLRMWVADDFSDLDAKGSYILKVNVYGAAPAQ